MHHALQIQEILSIIFDHFSPTGLNPYPCEKTALDLAALARTCHTFKEPALDVLWRDLVDLSPLARCIPEATRRSPTGYMKYSFSRPLTQSEWNILRSYTYRIRSIRRFNSGLDWESVATFLNPPTTELALFPNLRTLCCKYTKETMSLLCLPLPSLVNLRVKFENPHVFWNSLTSFPNFSPNISKLYIQVHEHEDMFYRTEPGYIRRWQSLCSVVCPEVALDVDALVHLSRMPALTRLNFVLSAAFPTTDSPLFFPNLHDLTLYSESLEPISQLLSQTRLPAITNFSADINDCPSRPELSSFLARIPTSHVGHTIERLTLGHFVPLPSTAQGRKVPLLDLEVLRPCMTFSNLRHLKLDIDYTVGLTDSQMLTLASTWTRLESLLINEIYGWNTTGGITLGGLVRLFRTCRSLSQIAVCLDTRGYVEVPPSQTPASLGLTLPPKLSINVLDSIIEAESMPAITAFFCDIATCSKSCFSLSSWISAQMIWFPNMQEYAERWDDVCDQVYDAFGERPKSYGSSDEEVLLLE